MPHEESGMNGRIIRVAEKADLGSGMAVVHGFGQRVREFRKYRQQFIIKKVKILAAACPDFCRQNR